MGENFFSNIRTADDIRMAIPSFYNISQGETKFIKDNLIQRKVELMRLYGSFQKMESSAYQKMGVGNLQTLQSRIDEINNNGLINLSANALRTFPILNAAKQAGYSEQAFEDALTVYFQEGRFLYNKEITQPITEVAGQWGFEKAIEIMASGIQQFRSRTVSKASLAKKFTIKENELSFNKSKDLKGYRKDIAAFLNLEYQTPEALQFKISAEYETESIEQIKTLDYYPYYQTNKKLTSEEINNPQVWNAFKNQIKRLAPAYSDIINLIMNQMGPASFIVSSPADMIGIFGELQMLVILQILGINKGLQAEFTGHKRNLLQNSAKIGIDAFLDNIGFQVKNYSGYFYDGQVQGINLTHNWTLQYFLSKVHELPIDEIGNFYALKSYHIKVDSSFSDVDSSFKLIEAGLKKTYLGFVDRFLPFEEIVKEEEDMPSVTMRNLFWFVSGKYIIPTSRIVNAYIKRISQLIKQIDSGNGLAVTSSYNGETYSNYYNKIKKGEEASMPTLAQVQRAIGMKVTINLHFSSLLSDILH